MRTTITIDDTLFKELMRLTQAKTRNKAIHRALVEWVHRQKIETLKALRGKLPIEGDLKDLHRLEIKEAGSLHG